MIMTLNVPIEIAQKPESIVEFAYIAQKKLRLLHNQKGADFKSEKITKAEWEQWKAEYFEPRSSAICVTVLANKEKLKTSTKYIIDLDNDFQEEL